MPNYRYTDSKVVNGDASMELDWWNDIGDVEVVNGGLDGSNGRIFRIGPNSSMWQTFDDPNFTPADIKVSGYVYLNNSEQEDVEALIKYTIFYLDGSIGRYAVPLRINLSMTAQGTIEGTSVIFYYFEDTLVCDEDKAIDYLRIDVEVKDLSDADVWDGTCFKFDYNYIDTGTTGYIITPTDITFGEGKFGGAILFNGSSSEVRIDQLSQYFTGVKPYTVAFWFNSAVTSGWVDLFTVAPSLGSNADRTLYIEFDSHKVKAVRLGATAITTATYDDNLWHLCVVTFDGATLTLNIDNGAEVVSAQSTGSNTPTVVFMGKVEHLNNGWLNGKIDGLRVADSVLDAAAINALYSGVYDNVANDPYTVLLLHMEGAHGSTAFNDSSLSTHIFTPAADAKISTQFYRLGSASGAFDGTGDFISTPDHANFNLADGDFTFECFIYPTAVTGYAGIASNRASSNSNYGWALGLSSGKLFFGYTVDGTTKIENTFTTTLTTNQWYHLAWVRQGSTIYAYINGVKELATINIGTAAIFDSTDSLYIGKFNGENQYFSGYIDEIRLSKGITRWTEDFVPPITQYSITLNSGSNYMFIDNISVNFNLGTTKTYGKGSETAIIDEYGLNTNYLKNFKNMLHNSQFEAYDADTEQPFYWSCSQALVKTTASANFFGTRSLQIPAGQSAIYDGTGTVNPTWYDSQHTRVSFYARGGTVRIEVYDYSDPLNPVRFNLTNENGTAALYHDYTFANWHAGTGNSASRATVSFDPGESTDVRIKFSNVGITISFVDAVVLEPDFTEAWPSMYSDGPYSMSPISTGIYVQATEPTGYAIKKGTLWLKTTTKRWHFWDGAAWQETAGGGGESVPGLYPGEPLVIIDDIDYSCIDTNIITSDDIIDTAVAAAISLSNLLVMLLHFNGTYPSTNYVDSSTYPKTFYLTGSYGALTGAMAKLGSACLYVDGTGDYLSVPDHASLELGSGDFTFECFVNPIGNLTRASRYLAYKWGSSGQYSYYIYLSYSAPNYTIKFTYSTTGSNISTITSNAIPILLFNTYYHIAVVRSGTNLLFFVDGVLISTHALGAITLFNSTSPLYLMADNTGSNAFDGMVDEIRMSNVARWTSNFTPPSSEYSNDANTALLLHCNGSHCGTTFTDSSSNAHVVTAAGNAITWETPQKFGSAAIWLIPNSWIWCASTTDMAVGSSDFTIDCWICLRALPASNGWMCIFSQRNSSSSNYSHGLFVNNNGGTLRVVYECTYNGSTINTVAGNFTWVVGTKYHVAVVRNGGTLTVYVDGVSKATLAIGTNTIYASTYDFRIGAAKAASSDGDYFHGWIDEFRFKRSAEWTSNFTPPVAEY